MPLPPRTFKALEIHFHDFETTINSQYSQGYELHSWSVYPMQCVNETCSDLHFVKIYAVFATK